MFLAGEVARDSLGARRVATRVWRALAERWPDAPLAPRALYAIVLLEPDSAVAVRAEILARYPTSAMAALLREENVVDAATMRAGDALLVVGPSGCVKSSLLRAVAGVWTKTLHYLEQSAAQWLLSGGAMAVMVPAVTSDSLAISSSVSPSLK